MKIFKLINGAIVLGFIVSTNLYGGNCPEFTPLDQGYKNPARGFEFKYPEGWEKQQELSVSDNESITLIGKGALVDNKLSFVKLKIDFSGKYSRTPDKIEKSLARKREKSEVIAKLDIKGESMELFKKLPRGKEDSPDKPKPGPYYSFYYPLEGRFYSIDLRTWSDGEYRECSESDLEKLVISVSESFK